MGKQIGTAEAEVGLSAAILDYYADRAEEFLAPQELPESPGAVVETEPIGVILAIEPWNFPYYQLARVAGPQLMAGNVVVVKHAENVPQCALAFARLFEARGRPGGRLHQRVRQHRADRARDRGPPDRRGNGHRQRARRRRCGRARRPNLKKVVMELGGSDPLIVLADADLGQAVEGALFGRMFNTGPELRVVQAHHRGRPPARRRRSWSGFSGARATEARGSADPDTDARAAVLRAGAEPAAGPDPGSRDGGAQVVLGGSQIDRPGYYLEPTILTDIT